MTVGDDVASDEKRREPERNAAERKLNVLRSAGLNGKCRWHVAKVAFATC